MKKMKYIHSGKITGRISPNVITGYHIVVEGITYELVSKTPIGRPLTRTLSNSDTKIQLYG